MGVRKEFHPYHLRNQLGVNVVISVAAGTYFLRKLFLFTFEATGEQDQTSTTFPLSVRTNSEVGFALDDWHKLHKVFIHLVVQSFESHFYHFFFF